MTITPLPPPPTKATAVSVSAFNTQGDAFMAAWPTMVSEFNADIVVVASNASSAATSASNASTSATNALASGTAAAASAASALAGTGTNATSVTSMTIATGNTGPFTIQTGKDFVPGQRVVIAETGSPSVNAMFGAVNSYSTGTGQMTVIVDTIIGSGTKSVWTVSISPSAGSTLDALSDAINDGSSVFVGTGAGSGDDGTDNKAVAVGTNAGVDNTSGSQNIYIGYNARGVTTGYRNIVIGTEVDAPSATANGQVVIANAIFATGAVNTGTSINSGMKVGIGTNAPQARLDVSAVNNVFRARATSNNDNTVLAKFVSDYVSTDRTHCQIFNDGDIENTNNSYGAISDRDLKQDIVDAEPKLEDLLKVKIRNFAFKNNPTFKQIGVVAQELEGVFPGLVTSKNDTVVETVDGKHVERDLGTVTKSVKYSVLVPILVKALQEEVALRRELRDELTNAFQRITKLEREQQP